MAQVQVYRPTSSPSVVDGATWEVRTKAAWGDDWIKQPFLYPVSAKQAVLPTIGTATFEWDYGEVIRTAKSPDVVTVRPADFLGYFVQIRLLDENGQTPIWTGIFGDDSYDIWGTEDATPRGREQITAYDLGYLLKLKTIEGAYYDVGGAATFVNRCPTFNERYEHSGASLAGNGSESIGDDGVILFSSDGYEWTNCHIVDYLLQYYSPDDVPFVLGGQAQELLGNIIAVHRLEGLSVLDAITHLCDRVRGMCAIITTTGSGTVGIGVYAIGGKPITAGDITIPANPHVVRMEFDNAADIKRAIVKRSISRRRDKVIVRGGRVVSCFTVAYEDCTLEKGWTDAEETSYKAGHVGSTNQYDHDAERRTDLHERVYQFHRIPNDWNGDTGDGAGGAQNNALPTVLGDGTLDDATTAALIPFGRRLLRWIPVPKAGADSDAEPEYMAPLVVLGHDTGATMWYYQVDKVDPELGIVPACSVRVADREMGLWVTPQIPHKMGSGHFDVDDADTEDSAYEPAGDYEELLATVAIETDERLTVEQEISSQQQTASGGAVTIDVEGAECWWIAPNTVVAVDERGLLYADGTLEGIDNGYVRDDSERLRKIAALASGWYGEERAQMELVIDRLGEWCPVGSYLLNVSSSWHRFPIGTIVTSKTWDFGARTTSFSTNYWELDFARIVDFPGMSGPAALGRRIRNQQEQITDLKQQVGGLSLRPATAKEGNSFFGLSAPVSPYTGTVKWSWSFGNGFSYDSATGIMTCLVAGVYSFSLNLRIRYTINGPTFDLLAAIFTSKPGQPDDLSFGTRKRYATELYEPLWFEQWLHEPLSISSEMISLDVDDTVYVSVTLGSFITIIAEPSVFFAQRIAPPMSSGWKSL